MEKKIEHISVRCTKYQKEKIKETAEKAGLTMSQYLLLLDYQNRKRMIDEEE